ncbi:MAG: rhodanese-like domain-containing protein [Rhizomicrobium sp.]
MRLVTIIILAAASLAATLHPQPLNAQTVPPNTATAMAQPSVPTLGVSAFRKLTKTKTAYFLIDVRQPDEFAAGHIDGAILMPLDRLPTEYTRIPKGVKLVVYCRSGHRSAQAVSFLRSNGYDKAVSLDGGFTAWSAAR